MTKTSVAGDGPSLAEVCAQLDAFLDPPTQVAREDGTLDTTWPPGGPWA